MKAGLNKLKNITAKSINDAERVSFSFLNEEKKFPWTVSTKFSDMKITGWMETNRGLINEKLNEHGAILFRGFQVDTIEKFQSFMSFFGQDLLEYKLRSSPRHAVGDKVYISTKYPPEYAINMHSESSYAPSHPKKIVFCCITPAEEGGETPIADNRLVLDAISNETISKFETLGVKYRRYFSNGVGMSWQETFQSDNKVEVEEQCRNLEMDYEWGENEDLILTWKKDAIWKHAENGSKIWFNHALFFNKYAPGYEELTSVVEEDKLPNNTFFGDGTRISETEVNEITQAYKEATIQFKWEKGDVLLLDNMLMAHGRNPFKGERNIVVSMT